MYYELSDSSVLHFLNSLYDLSEKQLIEVQHIKEQFLGQFSDVEGVTMEELAMRMEKGEVTLLDVRPRDEYETAHIPGLFPFQLKN